MPGRLDRDWDADMTAPLDRAVREANLHRESDGEDAGIGVGWSQRESEQSRQL